MQGDMQSYLIRTLLSEGRIRYQTAEATAKGVKPRLLEMEGPTRLLVSTTATRLHPENETRLFSLLVTDTPEQTKGVFKALAEQKRKPASLEQWRALQTWLEGQRNEVVVPYAPALAELVPPLAVRLRRDFRAVLLLIQAHAVMHQAQRQRDEDGWIVATLDDYRIVRHLVGEMVAEGIGAGVFDTVRETVEAVRTLTAEEGADEVDGEKVTSAKKVAGVLGVDKTATSRRIKSAVDGGYLKDLREHKNRPQKLAIGDPLPEKQDVLPDPDELLEKAIELGWVVHESEGIPSNGSNGGSGLQNGNNNPEQPNNPDGGNVDSSLINHCKNDEEVSVSTPNGTVKSDVLAKTRVGSDRSATEQPSIKKGLKRRRRRATQPTVQPSVQPSNPESEGDVDPLAERKARREGRILDALDAMYVNHEDRYHELPEGERKLIRAWVSYNGAPRNVTRPRDSYELKHVAEQFLGFYVSNASIKGALLEAGYEPAWSGPINMGFRVGPLPGSDWADKPYGPRTFGPSLLYTPAYIPEYPASRARKQNQWLRKLQINTPRRGSRPAGRCKPTSAV
jgi:hypothetical protein